MPGRRGLLGTLSAAVVLAVVCGCTTHPDAADRHALETARISDCEIIPDDEDTANDASSPIARATVEVVNDTAEKHGYDVRGDIFDSAGKKIGGMSGYVNHVYPGDHGTTTLIGVLDHPPTDGALDCRLRLVLVESDPFT